jgi:outer membrane protein
MMKMKNVITILLMTIGFVQASAQDTLLNLSLKDAIRQCLEKNLEVINAGLESRKSHFKLAEVQSKLFPQVEAYSNFNYYYSIPKMVLPGEIFGQTGMIAVQIGTKYDWSSGFKASQILYNQSYFTSLKLTRCLETIDGLSLQQKKEEMVYHVSQIYFLCLATSKQIDQLKITMTNTDKLLEIAGLQRDKGIILKVDYSRITVNKSNLQTQIDNLSQLYQQQVSMLKYLIGLALDSKVELTDSLSAESDGPSQPLGDFRSRTEIQLLEKQMEVTSLTRRMNKQSYLPSLYGFGQYYLQGQRDQFDFFKGGNDKFFRVGFIGVSLSIPVFDGFEKRAKIHKGDIELMQLQNTRKNTTEYFTKEYADARAQYDINRNIVFRQQENIKVAEESYYVSLQGYRQQVVPLTDLLLSESGLTEARLSYFNALLQLKNAGLELRKSKGELLNY